MCIHCNLVTIKLVLSLNGLVKRKQKHILDTARALYFQSGIGVQFWGQCTKTVVHLINRMPY